MRNIWSSAASGIRARLTEVLDQHEIACGESPRKQEDLPVGGNRESEAQLSFDGGRRGYGWWRTRKTEVQMSADLRNRGKGPDAGRRADSRWPKPILSQRTVCYFPTGSWGDDGTIFATLTRRSTYRAFLPPRGPATLRDLKQEKGDLHRWPQVLPAAMRSLFTGG